MVAITPLPRPHAATPAPTSPPEPSATAERHGLAAILTLIRTGGAATRLELERASSLGRAVVVDRLATLEQLGLIEDGVPGPSMGGRAPRTLRLRSQAGLILVASLERATVGVGLADLAGRIVFEHHELAELAAGPDAIFSRLGALISWVLERREQTAPLWGIGIGVPGAVETQPEDGFALQRLTFGPAWSESRSIEQLVVQHRAPVWVRSAFQMAAMGELGPPRLGRTPALLFVELGTEISAAVVAGGRLLEGALGVAGQVGHIWTGEGSTICRCGNIGCLETLAGSEAVIRAATEAAVAGRSRRLADALAERGSIGVAEIGTAAQLGDAVAAELLARSGRLIGATLAALVNAVNPADIVLGGELAQTGDILLAAVREAVYRHSHPLATRDLRIVRSNMGRSAGLAGAALVAVETLFAPGLLGQWIGLGSPLRHPAMTTLLAQAEAALAA